MATTFSRRQSPVLVRPPPVPLRPSSRERSSPRQPSPYASRIAANLVVPVNRFPSPARTTPPRRPPSGSGLTNPIRQMAIGQAPPPPRRPSPAAIARQQSGSGIKYPPALESPQGLAQPRPSSGRRANTEQAPRISDTYHSTLTSGHTAPTSTTTTATQPRIVATQSSYNNNNNNNNNTYPSSSATCTSAASSSNHEHAYANGYASSSSSSSSSAPTRPPLTTTSSSAAAAAAAAAAPSYLSSHYDALNTSLPAARSSTSGSAYAGDHHLNTSLPASSSGAGGSSSSSSSSGGGGSSSGSSTLAAARARALYYDDGDRGGPGALGSRQPQPPPPAGPPPSGSVRRPFSNTTASVSESPSYNPNAYCSNTASTSAPRGLVGLSNLGNTCYMNSCLQCVVNTPAITDYFLNDRHKSHLNSRNSMRGRLATEFGNLVKSMWSSSARDSLSPATFRSEFVRWAPMFSGYGQQDSQECLRFLLDGLHEDLNRATQSKLAPMSKREEQQLESLPRDEQARQAWERYKRCNDSEILRIFGGQLRSTIKCQKCGHESHSFDPFMDLSLPIPSRSACSLEDCLAAFTKEELLDCTDYLCGGCKKKGSVTKKLQVFRFPQVLVLHLKRFTGSFSRQKLSTNVSFAGTVDLREFSDGNSGSNFRLFAVSNHSGGLGGGHYTATCINNDDGKWYSYNDSHVRPVSAQSVSGPSAYILFYART